MKIFNYYHYCICFISILTFCFGQKNYLERINPDSLRFKSVKAYRSPVKPLINGVMDPGEWGSSNPSTEFFQIDPKELAPPSEKTTVRVMFDDEALYIFLEAFDSQPEKIKKTLA